MKRLEPVIGMAVLGLLAGGARAQADTVKGWFHFGEVRFTLSDALAYQADGKEPGRPTTMVVLTDFKIDRPAVMEAIDTPSAVMGQIFKAQRGNVVFVSLAGADRCGVSAYLGESAHNLGLGENFMLKAKTAGSSRVAGECATSKPGKMFDDEYDFALSYDVPVTAIPKPAALAAGGGEPGAAYLALVKAIQAADFATARRHLPAEQIPAEVPEPSEARDYFHGLALNYPKTATIAGGLLKGGQARLEILGVDNDGKKIRGTVNLKKTAGDWHVVDQGLYFTE